MRALIWKNIEIKEKGFQEVETIFTDEIIKFTYFLKEVYKANACYECNIVFDAQLYIILQKIEERICFVLPTFHLESKIYEIASSINLFSQGPEYRIFIKKNLEKILYLLAHERIPETFLHEFFAFIAGEHIDSLDFFLEINKLCFSLSKIPSIDSEITDFRESIICQIEQRIIDKRVIELENLKYLPIQLHAIAQKKGWHTSLSPLFPILNSLLPEINIIPETCFGDIDEQLSQAFNAFSIVSHILIPIKRELSSLQRDNLILHLEEVNLKIENILQIFISNNIITNEDVIFHDQNISEVYIYDEFISNLELYCCMLLIKHDVFDIKLSALEDLLRSSQEIHLSKRETEILKRIIIISLIKMIKNLYTDEKYHIRKSIKYRLHSILSDHEIDLTHSKDAILNELETSGISNGFFDHIFYFLMRDEFSIKICELKNIVGNIFDEMNRKLRIDHEHPTWIPRISGQFPVIYKLICEGDPECNPYLTDPFFLNKFLSLRQDAQFLVLKHFEYTDMRHEYDILESKFYMLFRLQNSVTTMQEKETQLVRHSPLWADQIHRIITYLKIQIYQLWNNSNDALYYFEKVERLSLTFVGMFTNFVIELWDYYNASFYLSDIEKEVVHDIFEKPEEYIPFCEDIEEFINRFKLSLQQNRQLLLQEREKAGILSIFRSGLRLVEILHHAEQSMTYSPVLLPSTLRGF